VASSCNKYLSVRDAVGESLFVSYRIVSHLFIIQMERGITVQRTLPNRVLNKWWWYARDIWSKFQATTGGLGTFLNNICFMSLSMGYWFSIGKWVLDFFFSFFFFLVYPVHWITVKNRIRLVDPVWVHLKKKGMQSIFADKDTWGCPLVVA